MSIDPRVASGLRDVPPSVMIPRERMLATFRETFASFGFVPIETPHIERMEVLTGKGAGSDEVLRQIFEVTNKGGEAGKLALRFDLTVPFARFVAKHVNELGTPFKRYAIGSVFRGERPAKGRFREFTQCDFDTVGTESAVADAETAQVIYASLTAAKIPAFTIAINNRKVLNGLLETIGVADQTARVLRVLDKLAKIGRDRVALELQYAEVSENLLDQFAAAQRIEVTNPQLAQELADSVERLGGLNESPFQTYMSREQADRLLDFVTSGRGGIDVLVPVETALRESESAMKGIENLRAIFDLLISAGVPESALKIDLSLAHAEEIAAYEARRPDWLPRVARAGRGTG